MIVTKQRNLGNCGETIADKYLVRHGYTIIARNYRVGHLEIDLVAKQNNQTIFIEVKTRLETADSLTENPLTKWQTANLKRAIVDYCYKNHVNFDLVRLDLIVILIDRHKKIAKLKHYHDIF